ncbi:hypothetical protein PISL3812_05588 [Talaromyces islandicus]|uniref:Proteophosphoglycan 5 n=1 Tax=Talaromyces islandicus TaxID=28573 RepID=A0A0U1LYZ7_TALIS|nr:hypothetical protein PISL3812_05588 [Talaromyces islandicus]
MSTQQPPTPKASRNSRRSQKKHNNAPSTEPRGTLLTTPPSSPPVSSSPGVAFAEGAMFNGDVNGNASSRKKNGTRSNKKSKENSRPNHNTQNSHSNHRHTSSQPSMASPPPLKDSPHYAGPTFHASPAPSALPMPSFFSKSVPDSGLPTALELDSEVDAETETEPEPDMTPSKPRAAAAHANHEPSPLDFLFKAAIDARSKAQQSPEVISKSRTPNTDSKAYQRPQSSANGIFSLELDEPERNAMPIGPAFATPYKDRMNALRSNGIHSQSTGDLNDAQRRVKTEELKNLLLNPKPQRPATASPQPAEANRGAVHGTNINYGSPLQTSSGPPTPLSAYTQRDARYANVGKLNYHSVYANGAPIQPRNASSALRQEFSPNGKPENAARMPHGHSFQSPYQGFSIPQRHNPPAHQGMNFHPSQSQAGGLDTKKMEDDLKRVLKLDLSSNMQPNGMQSSLA